MNSLNKLKLGPGKNRVAIKVKAGAKEATIYQQGDVLIVHVKELPIEGKANRAVIEALSDFLKIPKQKLSIKSGQTSRYKWIDIEG